MTEKTLVLRGLSPRLLRVYLGRMGARRLEENHFQGAGWWVRLAPRQVRLGRITLDEVEVRFGGDPQAVGSALARLRRMTLRGGG